MMNQGEPILSTENLSAGYEGSKRLLFEDLNLALYPRELVCFMGPNGAGKSTLLRTLSGLQKAITGKIKVGQGYLSTSAPSSKVISVVLTDRISAMNMTVVELISFGRYPYVGWDIRLTEDDHRIINNAIKRVDINYLTEKKLYELSDGQLQMVMIARALAQDTPIILLDEPTAHLDLNNRVQIMKLLRELSQQANKTVLVATHDLDLALQTADAIWLTGKNKNIITGMPEDLVLRGAFDDIFSFKGYDLKTGKVKHEIFQHDTITLSGEGYVYLWTKNALERNGFLVSAEQGVHHIKINQIGPRISWSWNDHTFSTLEALVDHLLYKR